MTNFAAHITQKLLGLHPSNFTGILSSLTCGAPPYFELSPLDDFGVIAPDKLKFHINYDQFCGTRNSKTIRSSPFKLHSNVVQPDLWCTSIFWIISPWWLWSYCPWQVEISHKLLPILRHANSKTIRSSPFKLHRNVVLPDLRCTSIFWIISPWWLWSYCPWQVEISH